MTLPIANHRKGFTLLEVLLALALGAIIMVYTISIVVNLSLVWLNQGDDDFFQQHADGVALFLSNAFARSVGTASPRDPVADELNGGDGEDSAPATRRGRAAREDPTEPVSWRRPPGYSEFDDPLLGVSLNEAPAILIDETVAMPAINGYLYFERGSGLGMLWYSRLTRVETLRDVRSTFLSPYLTRLEYGYYDRDADSWNLTENPERDQDGLYLLPDALQLTFTYQDERLQRAVYIPKQRQHVPLF